MPHFRQQQLFDNHYMNSKGESFTHTYKGKEYNVSPDSVNDLSPEVLQSVATRLRKENPSKKQPVVKKPQPAKSKEKPSNSRGKGMDSTKVDTENKRALIRRELIRLSKVEFLIEDKLNYPRVFKKLLSEPHLALYEKKMTVETKQDLYLFVDESVGYNLIDKGFHRTLIEEAKKIKGIKVYYGSRLCITSKGLSIGSDMDYYLRHIKKLVPKGKKVLVLSQGCGGAWGDIPKDYDLHFATHFEKGRDCGCDAIHYHERCKHVKMHYNIDIPEKLKTLEL